MKVVKLRDKSNTIIMTAKEALEGALKSSFVFDEVIIILHNGKTNNPNDFCEYWQGGGITVAEILWHLEQYKAALLSGRIEELD